MNRMLLGLIDFYVFPPSNKHFLFFLFRLCIGITAFWFIASIRTYFTIAVLVSREKLFYFPVLDEF